MDRRRQSVGGGGFWKIVRPILLCRVDWRFGVESPSAVPNGERDLAAAISLQENMQK
ncbi:hypothetical protein H6P81_015778 [Aristolochia fimbriata]|uniref:Uncharacterized protein n=1 Tax=Aristolochia fimbriata TaxID=158543 RepID=A0AAV7EB31_ARIFI|nr:hypothetical protein H6P81_015778 [Aristolochia fimbriata]